MTDLPIRNMKMTELKPCPFCGGEAVLKRISPINVFYVRCNNKNCTLFCGTIGKNTEEEAVRAWNTRPNPWHTGTPTEEGCFYALQCKGYTHPEPYFGVVVNGVFSATNVDGDLMPLPPDLIAWQKIEPFVGSVRKEDT